MKEIVEPLLDWYGSHARRLPWRAAPSAYTTWVSEIMLQQTRVETVIPYYERFIRTLPDVEALAVCPQDQLLKLWEGLGYYSRVRNMQTAAREIMEDYQGEIPQTFKQLRALKGIGDYTAGAIASIAFGEAVPAVDGNVLRVTARLTGDFSDIMKQSVRRRITQALQEIIPEKSPGAFNQAMMELGALVCAPGTHPDCEACPVSGLCTAYGQHLQAMLPVKTPQKARKTQAHTIVLLSDPSGRVAVSRRPSAGLLAGLYEPLNLDGHLSEEQTLELVRSLGLQPVKIEKLPETKHIFTHIEWRMTGFRISVRHTEEEDLGQLFFALPEEIGRLYSVPSAFSTYMDVLKSETILEENV